MSKGSGWHGESRRHAEASRKGWESRHQNMDIDFKPVNEYEARHIQNKRSIQAKKQDNTITAQETYKLNSPESYKWRYKYNQTDIIGVDDSYNEQLDRAQKQRDRDIKRIDKQKHTQHKYKKKKSQADAPIGNNSMHRENLERYAQKKAEENNIDYQAIDTDSIIDPTLSYSENQKLIDDEINSKIEYDDKYDAQYYAYVEDLEFRAEEGDTEAQEELKNIKRR